MTREPRAKTVGDLRAAIANLPDDMEIMVDTDTEDDIYVAGLLGWKVEERCDEIPCLYLFAGNDEGDEDGGDRGLREEGGGVVSRQGREHSALRPE